MPTTKKHLSVFIDSNVLAKWILLQDKESKNEKLLNSRTLVESILNDRFSMEFDFFHSQFVLVELYNVLYERHVIQRMIDEHIPFNDIFRERETRVPGTFAKIFDSNKTFIDNLAKKVSSIEKMLPQDSRVSQLAAVLISEKGCETHDAYLVSQAILSDCKIFVTYDQRLIEKIKKSQAGDQYNLQMMDPKTFLQKYKPKL